MSTADPVTASGATTESSGSVAAPVGLGVGAGCPAFVAATTIDRRWKR